MKFARFSVIDDERGLILGKDIGDTLEKGYVYEIVDYFGDLVIRKIGPYSLSKQGPIFPNEGSDVNGMVIGSRHLITNQEIDRENHGKRIQE